MTTSTENDNEDWLRSMEWDLPTTLPGLLGALGADGAPRNQQREKLSQFMGLPAWKPCPEPLRSQVVQFVQGYV